MGNKMNTVQLYWMSYLSVCALILSGCSKPEPEVEKPKIVMVAQPATSHAQQQSYAGEVQAKQQTSLAFRVGGQITDRYVDVGDRVVAGQVLAKLDVKDTSLQLNAAQAQLEQAQAAAKTLSDELKRFETLLPDNAVSRSQYDSVKNQYNAAQSNLKQAQANYEVVRNQNQYNSLVANKTGVITARNIEIGQVIAAGQPAYQLALDGEREVVIGVSEAAVSELKNKQQAWVVLWSNPDQRYAGYVREIAPAADQSRTFAVKVALEDRNAPTQIGQSARVFFDVNHTGSVYVPLPSVSSIDNKSYVWVVNPDNTLKRVMVTLGEYQRDSVAITNGLSPQQWVVIGGVHLLREKQKVRLVDQNNRPVEINASASNPSQAP